MFYLKCLKAHRDIIDRYICAKKNSGNYSKLLGIRSGKSFAYLQTLELGDCGNIFAVTSCSFKLRVPVSCLAVDYNMYSSYETASIAQNQLVEQQCKLTAKTIYRNKEAAVIAINN